MMDPTTDNAGQTGDTGTARDALEALRAEIAKAVVGQDPAVTGLVVALLCRGHVLLEGVPGVAKTLLVRALAAALELDTKRVQFTPDLMPSDVTGSLVYDTRSAEFSFQPGPVFTNLLLADEINRTPPRPSRPSWKPWRNARSPSTAPLASSPTPSWSRQPRTRSSTRAPTPSRKPSWTASSSNSPSPSLPVRTRSTSSPATPKASTPATSTPPAYAPWRVRPTWRQPAQRSPRRRSPRRSPPTSSTSVAPPASRRPSPSVSPRGATALLATARAWAWLTGRDYVIPDDVKALALPTLRHRVQLRPEAEMEGVTADSVINAILAHVPVPR